MIVTGEHDNKHLRNLSTVLQRLDFYGLRANLQKCQIAYCGHEIDKHGLHKSNIKTDAVSEARRL